MGPIAVCTKEWTFEMDADGTRTVWFTDVKVGHCSLQCLR